MNLYEVDRGMKMDCELVLSNIRKEFKEYVSKAKLQSVVLGISGGLDSAIVAAIVRPVCDKLKISLVGFSLPSSTNKDEEVWRANEVMFSFCTIYFGEEIDKHVKEFSSTLELNNPIVQQEKIALGNIKSRCRMILLYSYAFRLKGMVLGTDNLTEYNLGFWTLHGDVGDFSPIQNLWKSEVYELARWIVANEFKEATKHPYSYSERLVSLQACIDAVPTDGLGITSSDLEQIGVKSYEEADLIFKEYFELGKHKDSPVIQRYLRTMFKRNNPYNITREQLFGE